MMKLFVKYMSIGINNLINTFNTDLIVLNSSFSNYIPDINARIVDYLARHQNRNCRISPFQPAGHLRSDRRDSARQRALSGYPPPGNTYKSAGSGALKRFLLIHKSF